MENYIDEKENARMEQEREHKQAIDEGRAIVCADCGEVLWIDEGDKDDNFKKEHEYQYDDEYYCESCFYDNYERCEECGEVLPRDDMYFPEHIERMLCEHCLKDNYYKCDDCGEWFKQSDVNTDNADHCYCSNCIENYVVCAGCNEFIHVDIAMYDDETGEYYCEGCFPERENAIQRINFPNNTYNLIPKDITYGIELETASVPDNFDSDDFVVVDDGSIDGKEANSPILSGDKGLAYINNYIDGLEGGSVDTKCGYHLHVGKDSGYSSQQKHDIYKQYKALQEFFFDCMPNSRKDNSYCKKFNAHANTYAHDRYYWVNFISEHETIEIRLHAGTLDKEKIRNWIVLNTRLIKMVLNGTYIYNLNGLKSILPSNVWKFYIERAVRYSGKEVYKTELEKLRKVEIPCVEYTAQ